MQVFYWHLESKKCQNYAFLVQEYKRFTREGARNQIPGSRQNPDSKTQAGQSTTNSACPAARKPN